MGQQDWTEERVRVLERHWKKDKSAREIAELIGLSRNAVIGKAQRLGLGSAREQTRARIDAARSRLLADGAAPKGPGRTARRADPPAKPPKLTVVGGRRITMAGLTAHTCRFPFGERPRDLTFCGARAIEGSPYCAHHDRACHQPVPGVQTGEKQSPLAARLGTWT